MVTYILLAINVVIFVLIYIGKLDAEDFMVSYHWVFNRKQYYRLITSGFTHKDVTHIAFNMLSLVNVGTFVESLFGYQKMLIIYFVSMILGKIFALLINHNNRKDYQLSLGASGAICGLLGTYFLVVLYVYGIAGIQQLIRPLTSLVIMSILPGIDGTTHFTCMAVGMALTYLLIIL